MSDSGDRKNGTYDWEEVEEPYFVKSCYVHCPSRMHRISITICSFRCPEEYENKEFQCSVYIEANRATRKEIFTHHLNLMGKQRRLVPESIMEGGEGPDDSSGES